MSSYKEFINEKKLKYLFDLAQNFFSFRVVFRLRGKMVPPPKLAQSKIFFAKSKFFDITNKEMLQISKSKPKKISILCTFKFFK
jgi:hypothetical protein